MNHNNKPYMIITYNHTAYGYDDVRVARYVETLEKAKELSKTAVKPNTTRKAIVVHISKWDAFKADIAERNAKIRKAYTEHTRQQIARSRSFANNLFAETMRDF